MTIDVQVAEMRMILQLTQKTLKEFRKKFTFKECKRLLQVVCQFNLEAEAASVLEPPCVQVEQTSSRGRPHACIHPMPRESAYSYQ